MKYVNNIIMRDSFFIKKQLVGILCVITAVFLAACENDGTTATEPTDNRTAIAGTFSYVDIVIPPPPSGGTTAAETKLPIWEGDPTGQEIEYSIARVDGNSLGGVSIDSSTGEITLAAGATKSIASYTITATGTGTAYKGTIETNMDIWVQAAFSYNQVEITIANNLSSIVENPPTEANALSSTFALQEPSEGLEVAPDTGIVTVTPLLPNSTRYISGGTYVIRVTEGGETYGVGIDIVFPKPVDKAALLIFIDDTITAHGNEANLNFIDTSSITDMSKLFKDKTDFNGDISGWDVSKVSNMRTMFWKASAFNGDISDWDVSNVTAMESMFYGASAFNQNISDWDVGKVTNMRYMFLGAGIFNQDLSDWKVGKVSNMEAMFNRSSAFNGDISGWDVSKVSNMGSMFQKASAFNQNISGWDVSKVSNMWYMFNEASSFNQNLEDWKDKLMSIVATTSMFVDSGVTSTPSWYSTTTTP